MRDSTAGNAASRAPKRAIILEGRALWLSFAAATTGTFMVNLDSSVVNVALPVLQHQFALSIETLQWVITAYLLVITGLLPVTGRIADALGRREVFLIGIATFVAGSLFSALAPSFIVLVLARAFQALGGATIMANVMAIIALVFPVEKRGQALGLIGSVVAAGTLAGPPLGGMLTAWFGWRSIFWINLPIGIWGLWGSWRFLPRFVPDPEAPLKRMDWTGALLFLTSTSLLQFGLANWHRYWGMGLLGLDVVLVYGFIRWESSRAYPLIPLRLFRIRAFSRNLISGMAYWVLMMFPSFLLPFYLRYDLGLPVSLIGLSLMPQALTMILVSPLGGKWLNRAGVLWPGRTGMGFLMLADALFLVLPRHAPLWSVWAILVAVGAGAGLYSSPNNAAALNSVGVGDTGLASSLLATQRNMGRAVGVAFASIMLSVVWMMHGLGPNPNHADPAYPLWFYCGFRGAFAISLAFGVLGIWTLTAPDATREGMR
ncbi:MFS transporter [Sulfobacillus harzensis]|uniref:MFS transporter n=1 Tax=Sulfobacillus harzensis TaxID=2729629 RepID=A0A7Y0Q4W1_9FIRM|nr:MFS transporter [Sulfobacillus harzensis]NMP24451.1 MFS transporter [Sulfobacillus harzensis]